MTQADRNNDSETKTKKLKSLGFEIIMFLDDKFRMVTLVWRAQDKSWTPSQTLAARSWVVATTGVTR